MHKVICAALAAASLLAIGSCKQAMNQNAASGNEASANAGAPAGAADAINGTWKTDMSTFQLDAKPDEYLLKGGQFSCQTCTPPFSVAADGAFHPVNRPYQDHISVKVDDDHTVTRTDQKGGKTVGSAKYSVSSDGNTLTISFNDMSGSKPVTGTYTESRSAPAPAGAHVISGSWKQQNAPKVSDTGLTVTFNLAGDTLHMSAPTGQSYDAKLGGGEVPVKGDIGGTMASVTRNGDSFVETDTRGGKVISVTTMTPGADGKLHVVNEDKQGGSTAKFTMDKQ
jgi:hypothetical protein